MCFSVNKGVAIPPSLANIYTELASDSTPRARSLSLSFLVAPSLRVCVTVVPGFKAPRHGYLMRWAKQGVLLLNTVLTVAYALRPVSLARSCSSDG
jgi:uracil-DNA glycosylase